MRLLIGLAILVFVRGAPINDGAPEEAVQEQIAPETPALEEIVPESPAPPEEPKEVLARDDLAASEEEPASEGPTIPEELPASEEPVTPEEVPASEEPTISEEVPAPEEPITPEEEQASEELATPEVELASVELATPEEEPATQGVPELSKEQTTKPEAPGEEPIAPESEPIPETHEVPVPGLSDLEAPIEEPYKPAPGSHPTESYGYNPLNPSLPESEIIFPETTFIEDLLWALFGDYNENETDDFNFLWPFSEPDQQTSVVNYATNPLQAKGEVTFMIWSD